MGDNFHGFRIVGTTDAFFNDFEFEPGRKPELEGGRIFTFSEGALKGAFQEAEQRAKEREARERGEEYKAPAMPENTVTNRPFEAVIGSTVAKETGLQIGQTFIAAHGVQPSAEAKEHTENPWTVVGILKPTQTAVDRAIYINLDSFYHIEGHELRGAAAPVKEKAEEKDNDPDPGQVSSIVLKLRSPIHAFPALSRDQ